MARAMLANVDNCRGAARAFAGGGPMMRKLALAAASLFLAIPLVFVL